MRWFYCTFTDLPSTVCQDGTVIVHTVRRGQFLRTLRPPGDSCVPAHISELQVGMEGHIVVQTSLEERPHRKVPSHCTVGAYCNAPSNKFLNSFMPIPQSCFLLQGKYSIHVYSVNGCLLSSIAMEEQVTVLHLVSEYIILGTMQGGLHIRDLCR